MRNASIDAMTKLSLACFSWSNSVDSSSLVYWATAYRCNDSLGVGISLGPNSGGFLFDDGAVVVVVVGQCVVYPIDLRCWSGCSGFLDTGLKMSSRVLL